MIVRPVYPARDSLSVTHNPKIMSASATIPVRKLPPSFTSLYRLFLRTSSAAVLHHGVATRYVRTLWKPTFREAAVVVHKLQSPTLGTSERVKLERWHSRWESTSECRVDTFLQPTMLILVVDQTLSLLVTSAQSRGLAHKLTRNLSFLHYGFQIYQRSTHYYSTHLWDPQQREYKPARQAQRSQSMAKRFDRQSWGALEETARMAEGKSGITLGRMEFRLRRA
jgi:hypothetical protein